jgi:hypothetical protein
MAKKFQKDGDFGDFPAMVPEGYAKRFLRLRAEIENELAPKTLLDRFEVRDLSYKLSEEQRLKDLQTAVIESARVESLGVLLGAHFGQNIEHAHKTAQDYFSADEAKRQSAQKLVASLGISPENIEANAFHLRVGSVQALDDMIERRESGRNKIIKRHRKRSAERQQPSRATKQPPRAKEKASEVTRFRMRRMSRDKG